MAFDRGQVPTAVGLEGSPVSCAAGLLITHSRVYLFFFRQRTGMAGRASPCPVPYAILPDGTFEETIH